MTEYRGYKIVTDPTLMKKIEAVGRGSVHLSLRGLYTTERYAQKQIDIYENGKEEKGGEESKRSRS